MTSAIWWPSHGFLVFIAAVVSADIKFCEATCRDCAGVCGGDKALAISRRTKKRRVSRGLAFGRIPLRYRPITHPNSVNRKEGPHYNVRPEWKQTETKQTPSGESTGRMTSFLFSLMNFEQKINFLTSAGLIFCFFSFFCSTIKIAVHEIADGAGMGAREGNKGGSEKNWIENQTKLWKAISLDFFSKAFSLALFSNENENLSLYY